MQLESCNLSYRSYRIEGDYLVPNLTLPPEEPVVFGKYALLRRRYLKEHRRVLYRRDGIYGYLFIATFFDYL